MDVGKYRLQITKLSSMLVVKTWTSKGLRVVVAIPSACVQVDRSASILLSLIFVPCLWLSLTNLINACLHVYVVMMDFMDI